MITITKLKNSNNIIHTHNYIFRCHFSENKIWLNKREIANIFGIKKSEVKTILASISSSMWEKYIDQTKKVYDKGLNKEVRHYSLDILLSFGYRIDDFTDTKLLINVNTLLKNSYNKNTDLFKAAKKQLFSTYLECKEKVLENKITKNILTFW